MHASLGGATDEEEVLREAHTAFCLMVGGSLHVSSELGECIDQSFSVNSRKSEKTLDHTMQQDTQQNAQSAQDTHHNLHAKGRGLDESRVALVDTACTSCMHSRAWRMAFSRSLPEGQECQVTDRSKTFHFADGSTTSNRIAIWRIPIFIGGRPGQVMSAEVESGSTPLLLSVPSLEALDVVLRVKEMIMEVNTLGVQVPMLKTRTKHLAIEVAYNEKLGYETLPVPKGVSANEDFFVYFMEEAELRLMQLEPEVKLLEAESSCKVQLGARGVRPRDERGTLTDRRKSELDLAMRRVRAEDTRTWRALKHDYTVAEQFATRGFTDTVIFEPWGGSFPVTRMATKEFGWSCSQPLDLLDGYDLLTRGGQKLLWDTLEHHRPFLVVIAFDCRIWSLLTNLSPDQDWEKLRRTIGERTLDLVVAICIFQEKNGRYYLVENPKGSRAWVYRQKLQKLLEEHRGKFVVGDQCAFGKKDEESGLPIQKGTGWLSNNEMVLNAVGRRCSCPHGAHQQVIGSNAFGLRSRQAAEYPEPLCRAICRSVLQTMKLDYASSRGFAFPVEDEDEEMEDLQAGREEGPEDTFPEGVGDDWVLREEEGKLIRRHNIPRQAGFVPLRTTEPPVEISRLEPERKTFLYFPGGRTQTIEDVWTEDRGLIDPNQPPWTGETTFTLKKEVPLAPAEAKAGRQQTKRKDGDQNVLKRKRARTKQLQRGLWTAEDDEEMKILVQRTLEEYREQGAQGWIQFPLDGEIGKLWKNSESARADVQLVLASSSARRMRKPQPFRGPNEVPLRKGILLMTSSDVLTTGWEDWQKSSPASQLRPLPSQTNQFFVTLFGAELGDGIENLEVPEEGGERPVDKKERDRERQWQALPRELKLAIKRIHCNLGHARLPDMLRALRVSRASEVAIKACRLFRCKECPRLLEPKIPRPSKLPIVDEFGVMVGMDVFEEKDSNGENWSWLNIVDQGTGFQVCCLLQSKMPTSQEILEAFETSWANWAGMPEYGVIVDRAKNFLGRLSTHL